MKNYEEQAQEFLTKTGTTLKATFVKFDKYFADDKQDRNIWKITLKNNRHKYTFKFGASINDSCRPIPKIYSPEDIEIYLGISYGQVNKTYLSHKITTSYKNLLKVKTGEIDPATLINENQLVNDYLDFEARMKALPKDKRPFKFISLEEFKQKFVYRIRQEVVKAEKETFLGENPDKTAPTAYDILACLTKYDQIDFKNFCSDFGYDEESRRAYKTYKAVMREYNNIELLFTEEERELLNEIN